MCLVPVSSLAIALLASPTSAELVPSPDPSLRVATFNVKELSRVKLDDMDALARGRNAQLQAAAEIIQRLRPDVLVLNEIDFDDSERRNARRFIHRYLNQPQHGQRSIDYPYVLFLPSNTGVASGLDLDGDGRKDGPEDAWGFGHYPGQYGMALLSRLPIPLPAVRTFRRLRWSQLPDNAMPDGRAGKPAFYPPAVAAQLRLSSKSHWDVPIEAGGRVLHLLISHPTPPVFDGEEDRNGRRNFDEIRLWADYITGGEAADYLVDDRGRRGALAPDEAFIILGDLNADPVLGARLRGHSAIGQLLENPRIQDPRPRSLGAGVAAGDYPADASLRTAAFGRADYILPSRGLSVRASGVFWPPPGDELATLAEIASDHHLVWLDLDWP